MLMLLVACQVMSQTTISGIVTDGREPLAGANVFIIGTIDGCLTDSLGRFSFQTSKTGEMTLRATFIGFDDATLTTSQTTGLSILMREKATAIDEVVVTANTYSFGKSDNFKTMDALDVVMAGNSCGDVVAALQTLPGTQKVGEDGKLYVRGGESNECQTFVNGMHVLVPYTTTTGNTASRGRFSPFLFKGINFSLGGYSGEYGQALSSVLPMETTDVATGDKLGVSASMVDWNAGGTKAYDKSSLSFNADYTSMGLYDALFPDRRDWTRPYRKLSGEAQYKAELSSACILKAYAGYDLSSVGEHIDNRRLSLLEHNIYANTTLKTNIGGGYSLFTGIANSTVINDIDDALVLNDSERLYLDYTTPRTPDFASRHNLRLTLKYAVGKFIVGLAESYASSRRSPIGRTPYYNSVDANVTYLLNPKVIVYTSLNNILGRTNIFGYNTDGSAITATRDRFFYIGIFVSLKNNKAYDISNF